MRLLLNFLIALFAILAALIWAFKAPIIAEGYLIRIAFAITGTALIRFLYFLFPRWDNDEPIQDTSAEYWLGQDT